MAIPCEVNAQNLLARRLSGSGVRWGGRNVAATAIFSPSGGGGSAPPAKGADKGARRGEVYRHRKLAYRKRPQAEKFARDRVADVVLDRVETYSFAPECSAQAAVPSTVDLTTGTYTNEHGATELMTVWTDPNFDPSQHAFYYARVLEIPTPRWTTVQAVKLGVDIPDVVPAVVQERAWSSPIWYAAAADATASSDAVTVASLEESGATALTDDDLTALIVDKAVWVRNNVTGAVMKVHYDKSGTFDVNYVGSRALQPSLTGDLARDTHLELARPYTIANGQINTFVSSTPIGMKVYKTAGAQAGNTQKQHATYYGARSNEFGYANYEILLTGPGNLVELPKDKMDIPTDNQPDYLHLDVEQ